MSKSFGVHLLGIAFVVTVSIIASLLLKDALQLKTDSAGWNLLELAGNGPVQEDVSLTCGASPADEDWMAAPAGRFQYVVTIRRRDNDHKCSGLLIDMLWVLTSAHCIEYLGPNLIVTVQEAGGDGPDAGAMRSVVASVLHPKWNGVLEEGWNAGLLRLHLPVHGLRPVLAAPKNEFYCSMEVTLFRQQDHLQMAKKSVVPNDQCPGLQRLGADMFCAFSYTAHLEPGCLGGPAVFSDSPAGSNDLTQLREGSPTLDLVVGIVSHRNLVHGGIALVRIMDIWPWIFAVVHPEIFDSVCKVGWMVAGVIVAVVVVMATKLLLSRSRQEVSQVVCRNTQGVVPWMHIRLHQGSIGAPPVVCDAHRRALVPIEEQPMANRLYPLVASHRVAGQMGGECLQAINVVTWGNELKFVLDDRQGRMVREAVLNVDYLPGVMSWRRDAFGGFNGALMLQGGKHQRATEEQLAAGQVPCLPAHYVASPDFEQAARNHLIQSQAGARKRVSIEGMPDSGKTALAVSIVRSAHLIDVFQDGVLWMSVHRYKGNCGKPAVNLYRDIYRKVLKVIEEQPIASRWHPVVASCWVPEWKDRDDLHAINAMVSSKKFLLVLDNVQDEVVLKAALKVDCALIVISQIMDALDGVDGVWTLKVTSSRCPTYTMPEEGSVHMLHAMINAVDAMLPRIKYNMNTLKFLHACMEKAKITLPDNLRTLQAGSPELQSWKVLVKAIQDGKLLVSSHAKEFDLLNYYPVAETVELVEACCTHMLSSVEQLKKGSAAGVPDRIPECIVQEDTRFLEQRLEYLVGVRDSSRIDDNRSLDEWEAVRSKIWGPLNQVEHICRTDVNWERKTVIASGGQGTVYRTKWKGKWVAIKVPRGSESGIVKQTRLLAEAALCARFNHAHIARVLAISSAADRGGADPTPFLVMELATENLDTWNRRQDLEDWSLKRRVLFQIATGLGHLHENDVVHRDIKPQNILVFRRKGAPEAQDSCPIVKLCDLGAGVVLPLYWRRKTTLKEQPGTLLYQAPEILNGKRSSPESDVYSYGMVMMDIVAPGWNLDVNKWDILSAKRAGELPWKLPVGCPEDIKKLIKWCLLFESSDRPNIGEVIDILGEQ